MDFYKAIDYFVSTCLTFNPSLNSIASNLTSLLKLDFSSIAIFDMLWIKYFSMQTTKRVKS